MTDELRAVLGHVEDLRAEIVNLKEQLDTCRELRKYDRIEIERLRSLLENKP